MTITLGLSAVNREPEPLLNRESGGGMDCELDLPTRALSAEALSGAVNSLDNSCDASLTY